MIDPYNLQRFVEAQLAIFDTALAEIRAGRKQSHWMWFIFPQLRGLGRSAAAQYYGISSLDEARAYLAHAILGSHLRDCTHSILPWVGRRSAEQIFGSIDGLKLRSSMTLFDKVEPRGLFAEALDKFYDGQRDERTLALLNGEE